MRDCLHYAPMIGARPGELSEVEVKALAAHLAMCERCQGAAADLAATEGLVSEGLLARANAIDFASFADEVMEKAGLAEPRGRGILGWLALHWKGTLGTAAPVVAALVAFMYVRSSGGPHEMAFLELASEGNVATVLQTSDGPVVLLAPEEHGS
jgi:anti-sigma factor RsiW